MRENACPSDSSRSLSTARALQAAGAGTVLSPGEPDYAKAMGRVFSTEAALTRPLCIVQPETSAQVAATLGVARDLGCSVTGRGGGLGLLCAADQAVMLVCRHISPAA